MASEKWKEVQYQHLASYLYYNIYLARKLDHPGMEILIQSVSTLMLWITE